MLGGGGILGFDFIIYWVLKENDSFYYCYD